MHCFLIHTLGCAALSASGGGGGAPTSAAALSGTTVSVLAVRFVLVFCACAAADVVVVVAEAVVAAGAAEVAAFRGGPPLLPRSMLRFCPCGAAGGGCSSGGATAGAAAGADEGCWRPRLRLAPDSGRGEIEPELLPPLHDPRVAGVDLRLDPRRRPRGTGCTSVCVALREPRVAKGADPGGRVGGEGTGGRMGRRGRRAPGAHSR